MEIVISVSVGILIYFLVLILFHHSGVKIDTMRRRIDSVNNLSKKPIIIDDEMNKPLTERVFKPILKSIIQKISSLIPNSSKTENLQRNRQEDRLKAKLVQAGFTMSTTEYNILRFFIIFGSAFFFLLIAVILKAGGTADFLSFLFGLFLGYVVMRYSLAAKITRRRKLIEQKLPDVLDLLSISVEAGLGFDQALNHIISGAQGPLIDELTVTYREISMGRARKEALILLGERCNIEEVKAFVSALVQAGLLGIPLKNVLRSQADAMRQARKAKIQEKAMKVSVKILLPMVLFIFPVIFIVILSPAIVSLLKSLGQV